MRVVSILAMRLLVLGLLVVGLAACGAAGGGGPSDLGGVPTTIVLPSTTIGAAIGASVPAPATPQTVLPDYASLVATAITPGSTISVYDAPNVSAGNRVVASPTLIPARRPGRSARYSGSSHNRPTDGCTCTLPFPKENGWVRDTDVTITQVSYRMHVALSAGTLTVFGRGRQIYTGPIVVGMDAQSISPAITTCRDSSRPRSRAMTGLPFIYGLINKLSTLIPLGTPVDIVALIASQSANAAAGSAYVLISIALPLGSAIIALVCARGVPA